jgi:hypothetical protein
MPSPSFASSGVQAASSLAIAIKSVSSLNCTSVIDNNATSNFSLSWPHCRLTGLYCQFHKREQEADSSLNIEDHLGLFLGILGGCLGVAGLVIAWIFWDRRRKTQNAAKIEPED